MPADTRVTGLSPVSFATTIRGARSGGQPARRLRQETGLPAYYPVYLDLRGRRCVVVGANDMCEEKLPRLLDCGADAVVIGPDATERISEMAAAGEIEWLRRGYRPGDLNGAFVAIVADTTDAAMNEAVSEEARERGIPLNVVDVTHLCSWIAPAVVRRGEVMVAVSTGGASPALARRFREQLSGTNRLPTGYGVMEMADLAPLLSEARGELARSGQRVAVDHWQACLTDELLELVQSGQSGRAMELLRNDLQQGVDCDCGPDECRLLEERAGPDPA